MIDENEFFRQATLQLCGHLAIEEGLRECRAYLSQHMPADSMLLQRFEWDLGAMRLVAEASAEGAARLDTLVALSDDARAQMESGRTDGHVPPVFLVNDSAGDPITRCLLNALGLPPSSVLGVPLVVGGRVIGSMVIRAEGDDRYDEHHARLYATLREPAFVAMANTLQHEEVVKLKDRFADDNRFLRRELLRLSGDAIVGADFGLKPIMTMVRQVAPIDTPVLITGETGVGKDVIANAIHLASERRDGPFVAVNCGAIPDTLLDSELFGHEKGAFTGALARKRGRFERAHEGTIFLDEIGEMPLNAQVRLLRVLQHREIERIGGTDRIPVDIRVIAATNQDLPTLVRAGRFREDLWFRLNVFPIEIPPLRQRRGDIPALVQHFLERKVKTLKRASVPQLEAGAIDALKAYAWPGNVRELENLVERAMILCGDGPLRFDTLAPAADHGPTGADDDDGETPWDLDAAMAVHIRRALARTGGRIHGADGAGALLGVNPNTLRSRMRKLGIAFGRQAAPDAPPEDE